MVWNFIGVYLINRTLHGRLEIRNFSSRVEKIRISARPCNILYIFHKMLLNFPYRVTLQEIMRAIGPCTVTAVNVILDEKLSNFQLCNR